MNTAYFIIGASGSGKTTAVKLLQKTYPHKFNYFYFDTIGVPTPEEMIRDHGSGENWQRVATKLWAKKIKDSLELMPSILDGQTRPSFIEEACQENSISLFEIILFDCTDDVRKQRLTQRGQPELAGENMMSWAKYLRDESSAKGYKIIENTNYTVEQGIEELLEKISYHKASV